MSVTKLTTVTIQGYDLDQLRNCIRVAMHQFAEDAKMFRNAGQHTLETAHRMEKKVKGTKKHTVPLITDQGAVRLAEQFEHQAEQAAKLYEQLEHVTRIIVPIEPE